jgi:hypothetical protein
MKFVVYTRVERVVYVLGIPGKPNPLADALQGVEKKVHKWQNGDQYNTGKAVERKGFSSMARAGGGVLYCERVGVMPPHQEGVTRAVYARAKRRASALEVAYGDQEVGDGPEAENR